MAHCEPRRAAGLSAVHLGVFAHFESAFSGAGLTRHHDIQGLLLLPGRVAPRRPWPQRAACVGESRAVGGALTLIMIVIILRFLGT
ncbi:hypothetical protein GCM10020220_020620 [Nonomuraea rubra]